ncbi:hypothetical protein [Trueperella pyogenes]
MSAHQPASGYPLPDLSSPTFTIARMVLDACRPNCTTDPTPRHIPNPYLPHEVNPAEGFLVDRILIKQLHAEKDFTETGHYILPEFHRGTVITANCGSHVESVTTAIIDDGYGTRDHIRYQTPVILRLVAGNG